MGPCRVIGCPNKGVYKFPQKESIRLKWIQAMKLEVQGELGWKLRKYSSICSEHFKQSDFFPPLTSSSGVKLSKRLKKYAIPSIFPWNCFDETGNSSADSKPKRVAKTYSRTVLPMAFKEIIPFKESSISDNGPQDCTPPDPLQLTDHESDDLCYEPS